MLKPGRNTVKAVYLSLGLFAGAAALRYAQTHPDDPAPVLTSEIIKSFSSENSIVHLGDSDHGKRGALMRFLSTPATMAALREKGITMLCLEGPAFMQMTANSLAQGEISCEEYADALIRAGYKPSSGDARTFFLEDAKIIQTAADQGLKVRLVNSENGAAEYHQYLGLLDRARINNPLKNFGPAGNPDVREKELSESERAEIYAAYKNFLAARKDDSKLSSRLENFVKNGEKILLVYGAGHGAGLHDLNELLAERGIGVAKINAYEDEMVLQEANTNEPDKPGSRYVFSTGRLLKTAAAPQAPTPASP